ncbi:MAG: ComEC/Rec2 family competence protein, partial [Proteobacteria bacterium]|nr:ComEC/Rec2 family competence protein [Pseudomonadota bacterium]
RAALYVGGVGFTTLLAGMATAPFGVFHFNQFSFYSLLANLIAVPVTSLWVMPLCVAAFALMPFGLEAWALIPMRFGLDVVLGVARTVAELPGATIRFPTPPAWAFAVFVLGGLWLCLWRRWPRLIVVGVMAVGLFGFGVANTPDVLIDREARIAALYVEGAGFRSRPRPASALCGRQAGRRTGDGRRLAV